MEFNFELGGHFGGDVNLSNGSIDVDVDIDGGFLSRLTFDYFTCEYFGIGLFTNIGTSSQSYFNDITIWDIGVEVKGRYPIPIDDVKKFLITANLGLGYRGLFNEGDTVDGMALNFGVDFRLRLQGRYDLYIEPGFISQPVGGASGVDVTFSPIPYLLVGGGIVF